MWRPGVARRDVVREDVREVLVLVLVVVVVVVVLVVVLLTLPAPR